MKDIIEKIKNMDSRELRTEYFRPDEGMRVYHVSRGVVLKLAREADALYRIGKCCVIDKKRFDANLEKYKVKGK